MNQSMVTAGLQSAACSFACCATDFRPQRRPECDHVQQKNSGRPALAVAGQPRGCRTGRGCYL